MSLEAKDMFTRISDHTEKMKIFFELSEKKVEVLCKPTTDDIIHFHVQRMARQKLVCSLPPHSSVPHPLPDTVVATFFLGTDKYFFMAKLSLAEGEFYELDLSQDLFHLQRRQSYRIRIPDSYHSRIELSRVNDQPNDLEGTIHDLSSGGCRILLPQGESALNSGDRVEGVLHIGVRPTLPFVGEVRHAKVDSQNSANQMIGIEFVNMNPAMETRLFGITMELHRELFSRWLDRH